MNEVAALAVAAVLLAAGVLKLRDPRTFGSTLRKLGPHALWRRLRVPAARRTARVAARSIAAAELAVAVGLTMTEAWLLRLSAASAVALGLGFTVAVVVAVRKGATCGCFGSLRTKAAGRVELARAAGVLVAAVAALAWPPVDERMPIVLRVAVVAGGAVAVRTFAASRLVRPRPAVGPAAHPPEPPPVAGAIERLRALPEMQAAEVRLAAEGTGIDWTGARVAAAGSTLVISAGRRPGAILTARLGRPGETLTATVAAGPLRLSMRAGAVTETTVEEVARTASREP